MKENMYQTTGEMATAAYALMMVFFIFSVVTIALGFRYYRQYRQFKQEKQSFRDMQLHRGSVVRRQHLDTDTNTKSENDQFLGSIEDKKINGTIEDGSQKTKHLAMSVDSKQFSKKSD